MVKVNRGGGCVWEWVLCGDGCVGMGVCGSGCVCGDVCVGVGVVWGCVCGGVYLLDLSPTAIHTNGRRSDLFSRSASALMRSQTDP